jgi:glucose-1-phosphate adenylyltransferase
VEEGAVVEGAVIMHDTFIDRNVHIERAVIDKKSVIGENARVGFGDASVINHRYPKHLYDGLTIIGKWANVPANAVIGTNCIIGPGTDSRAYPENLIVNDGETIEEYEA